MGLENPALDLFSVKDQRSVGALKHRYHELLKLYHPDRHSGRAEWANQMVRSIIAAYNTLKAPVGKAGIDAQALDLRQVIQAGDLALRRAVLLGWLRHVPRQPRDRELRARIGAALESLVDHPDRPEHPAWADFYGRLFGAFLDATDPAPPLPYPWSAPNAFRDLRAANALLEKGIRDFYHHRERGRLDALGAVALSYLNDASRFYSYVSRRLEPGPVKEVAQSRIAIATAFQERIRNRTLLETG